MGAESFIGPALQAGTGAMDAMMGMASQIFNFVKNVGVAGKMAEVGGDQSTRFNDQVLNPAQQYERDLAEGVSQANKVMGQIPGIVSGSKANYAGINENAQSQSRETKAQIAKAQADAAAELAKREQEFKEEQQYRDTTLTQQRAQFGSIAATVKADYSASAITANKSIRENSELSIQNQVRDWQNQGIDGDTIKRRVLAMREGRDRAITQNTEATRKEAADKSASVLATGEQVYTSTLGVLSSSLTGARSAMSEASGRMVSTDVQAAALTEQANEFLTGTAINVAGALSSIDMETANATANVANMIFSGAQSVTAQRNYLNQLRTQSTEYIFNTQMAGLGVIANANVNLGVGTNASFSQAMAPAFANLTSLQVAKMQSSQQSSSGGWGSAAGGGLAAAGTVAGALIGA